MPLVVWACLPKRHRALWRLPDARAANDMGATPRTGIVFQCQRIGIGMRLHAAPRPEAHPGLQMTMLPTYGFTLEKCTPPPPTRLR